MEATGLGAAQLAARLGGQRTHMYREEIPLPTTKLRKCIIDLVLVTDLAFELFQGDVNETRRWMMHQIRFSLESHRLKRVFLVRAMV